MQCPFTSISVQPAAQSSSDFARSEARIRQLRAPNAIVKHGESCRLLLQLPVLMAKNRYHLEAVEVVLVAQQGVVPPAISRLPAGAGINKTGSSLENGENELFLLSNGNRCTRIVVSQYG